MNLLRNFCHGSPSISCPLPAAEAAFKLVHGLKFHEYNFNKMRARSSGTGATSSSEIVNPTVHLLAPTAAVIAYDRVVHRAGKPDTTVAETRGLVFTGGHWKQAHFHRSDPAAEAAALAAVERSEKSKAAGGKAQ